MFPDPKVQWRLNWFNEIKMPLLLSCLLYNGKIDLVENMEELRKTVKLSSLSVSEKFIKSAMKNKDIHDKSVSLVNAAIIDMCGF